METPVGVFCLICINGAQVILQRRPFQCLILLLAALAAVTADVTADSVHTLWRIIAAPDRQELLPEPDRDCLDTPRMSAAGICVERSRSDGPAATRSASKGPIHSPRSCYRAA